LLPPNIVIHKNSIAKNDGKYIIKILKKKKKKTGKKY